MKPRLFGCSVSIADNVVVIGSPSVGSKGCVHTYILTDRNFEVGAPPLYPHDGHTDDGFGVSCKVIVVNPLTLRLVVGAHRKTEQGMSTGATYVYTSKDFGKSWIYDCQLTPSVKIHKSFFGCSVDMCYDTIVVGAYGDNTEAYRNGSACVYKLTETGTWNLVQNLYPSAFLKKTTATCLYFGFAVSITNNLLQLEPQVKDLLDAYIYFIHKMDGKVK